MENTVILWGRQAKFEKSVWSIYAFLLYSTVLYWNMELNSIFLCLIFPLLTYTGRYNKIYYFFPENLDLILPLRESIVYTSAFSIVSPSIYVKLMYKLFTADGCLRSLLLFGHFKRIFWKHKYISIYPHFSLSTIFLLIHNKALNLFTRPCLHIHIKTHYSIEHQDPCY